MLNLIIYQPGFAGHFLETLLSIDTSTTFLKPASVIIDDTVSNRLEYYSFDNSYDYTSWRQFHHERQLFISNCLVSHNNSNRYKCIHGVHPIEYVNLIKPSLNCEYRLFIVDLSYNYFNDFWLLESRRKFNNFPILRVDEQKINQSIIDNEPITSNICLDKFLNPDTWINEYLRLCELFNVESNVHNATSLYQSWYDIRVAPIQEDFNELTEEEKETYSQYRKLVENNKSVIIKGTKIKIPGWIE